MTQLENIHFWLNSIHAQAPSAPIIVVGTKADTVNERQRAQRIDDVKSSFVGTGSVMPSMPCTMEKALPSGTASSSNVKLGKFARAVLSATPQPIGRKS